MSSILKGPIGVKPENAFLQISAAELTTLLDELERSHSMTEPEGGFLLHQLIEPNGKTIKGNNLAREHAIAIGQLVEVRDTGVRLYVVRHDRDCDGTPLYSLSFTLESAEELGYPPPLSTGHGQGDLKVVHRQLTAFKHAGKTYFIVAKNGLTSGIPFPHGKLYQAKAEAKRLAELEPDTNFYVYAQPSIRSV